MTAENKKSGSSKQDFRKIALNKKEHAPDLAKELYILFPSDRYLRHQPIGGQLPHGFGGVVEHIVIAIDVGELVSAAKAALKTKTPYTVIGGGTGSLFSEVGFPGLVIVNKSSSLVYGPAESEVTVDSGVTNGRLVNDLATRNLSGLEFLAGVPGSIGGAVVTRASLDGKTINNVFREVVVFVPDKDGGQIISVSSNEFYGSKETIFSSSDNSPIILRIRFRLSRLDAPEILRRMTRIRALYGFEKILPYSLGYVFSTPLSEQKEIISELKKVVLPKNIYINWRNPDIVQFKLGRNVLPTELRESIQSIVTSTKQHNGEFGIRLRFLGYWPSRGIDDN